MKTNLNILLQYIFIAKQIFYFILLDALLYKTNICLTARLTPLFHLLSSFPPSVYISNRV